MATEATRFLTSFGTRFALGAGAIVAGAFVAKQFVPKLFDPIFSGKFFNDVRVTLFGNPDFPDLEKERKAQLVVIGETKNIGIIKAKIILPYGRIIENQLRRVNVAKPFVPDSRITPEILTAQIFFESQGNPSAIGKAGEIGLTQFMQIALDDIRENFRVSIFQSQLHSPLIAIQAQIMFLSLQLKRTGNIRSALRAYNEGFKKGNRFRKENSEIYANKILLIAGILKELKLYENN